MAPACLLPLLVGYSVILTLFSRMCLHLGVLATLLDLKNTSRETLLPSGRYYVRVSRLYTMRVYPVYQVGRSSGCYNRHSYYSSCASLCCDSRVRLTCALEGQAPVSPLRASCLSLTTSLFSLLPLFLPATSIATPLLIILLWLRLRLLLIVLKRARSLHIRWPVSCLSPKQSEEGRGPCSFPVHQPCAPLYALQR